MTNISEHYTATVHKNLKPLFGNWEPSKPLALGDYGIIEGYTFNYLGNIKDLNIQIAERKINNKTQKNFSSDNSTEVIFHGKGQKYVNAAVEINFKSANSVFFNASGCEYVQIEDLTRLGKTVMNLYKSGRWNKSWAIVTEIINSESSTILISNGISSSIILEASTTEEFINLADVSVKLSINSQKNIGYQTLTEGGMTPLFGLSKLLKPFLQDRVFKPFTLSRETEESIGDNENIESLFFGLVQID